MWQRIDIDCGAPHSAACNTSIAQWREWTANDGLRIRLSHSPFGPANGRIGAIVLKNSASGFSGKY